MSEQKSKIGLRTESLLLLAWPIFLQNTTNSLVVFLDFWFFSFISDETAGVIGQLLPIFWIGAFVIPVFAGTGISVSSQYLGAGRHDRVVPTYMLNILLTLGLGTFFSIFLLLNADELGLWIGMEPDRSAIGGEYFGVIGYYFILMSGYVAYNAILSSRGMTNWLMYLSFLVAGTNLALNSLFVFVFDFGVRGIALASLVSVMLGLLFSIMLVHQRLGIRFYFKGVGSKMKVVLQPIIRLGISNSLEPLSYTIQQIIISAFIVALGITSMAANSYAGRLQIFQITFSISLAGAAQILMAHWMGSGKLKEVNSLFWKTLRYGCLVAFLYAVGLWVFADWALALFTDDSSIITLGKSVLIVSILLEPARAVNIIGGFSLKTVGDARFPVILGMIFIWGVLPVIYFIDLSWGLSLVGLWVCFAADEILRALINLSRWKSGKWRSMGFARND